MALSIVSSNKSRPVALHSKRVVMGIMGLDQIANFLISSSEICNPYKLLVFYDCMVMYENEIIIMSNLESVIFAPPQRGLTVQYIIVV